MDKFHSLEVTHAALERALLKLDFKVLSCETHRLYENEEYGTILMMPPYISKERRGRPALFFSTRHAVAVSGVADRATLERLPTEEAPTEQAPTPAEAATRTALKRRSHQPGSSSPAIPAEAH